ncbi:MAG: KPN_02809 family neutral zinc metallopeptidase [Candidatus Rokuibacteriota bacterium]
MRWQMGRRSRNVEDRRGLPIGGAVAGGGIGMVVLVVLALFLGVDPTVILQGDPTGQVVPAPSAPEGGALPEADPMREFVAVVLADTEDTWRALFPRMGRQYQDPTLVLFSGAVRSACGMAGAAVGPFYCPADRKVYIDLAFYRDLRERFRAPGDFAQAYVIAHEVGHHVQTLLGISQDVAVRRQRLDPERGNALAVRLELQADCLAGLWAHHADRARQILEAGDVEEALNAAAAIGDDRIQARTQGHVVPESFTHGTSEQRVRWFRRGLQTGAIEECDTFAAARL